MYGSYPATSFVIFSGLFFSFYQNNIKELITEKNNDALTYKFQRVNTIHTTQSSGMTNMRL